MVEKYKKQLITVFIVILALYPMLRIWQGLSVMDTTYSVSNFTFFGDMNGTWMVATYLANVVGSMFTKLPFGNTLIGINFYTSLIVSGTAVFTFIYLKRDIPVVLLFLGELLALSLCWCPTTILYNYLTYFLFALGALTLYRALSGGRRDLFVAAGILLGLNVLTRFPNIAETALILTVWYVGYIEKKQLVEVVRETLLCVVGYLLGFFIPLFTVAIRFTASAYSDMIRTLFAMTDKATDYKPTSMVLAMFEDYVYAGKWIFEFLFAAFVCGCIFHALNMLSKKDIKGLSFLTKKRAEVISLVISVLIILVLIRIVYGQGMFSFAYYEYRSMYFWAILFIALTTVLCFIFLFIKEIEIKPVAGADLVLHHKKILACIVLIITYVTCLGSNNAMFPIVNNLFLVAPFTIWCLYDFLKAVYENPNRQKIRCGVRYGGCFVGAVIVICLLIQGVLFHSNFALQDGDDGQPRKSTVVGHEQAAFIKTTSQNAEAIQGVLDYVEENDSEVSEVILYGNVPGFGFLLGKSSALTTFWPDLDSYTYDEWTRDLHEIKNEVQSGMPAPLVITSIKFAAWEGGQKAAIEYFGLDEEELRSDDKVNDLVDFLHTCGYKQVYCNEQFSVYYLE